MSRARQARSAFTRMAAAAIAGAMAIGVAGCWAQGDDPDDVSPSPTVSPDDAVARVTEGDGFPAGVQPLSPDVADRVGSAWTLAEYRGFAVDAQGDFARPGPTVLYLVSPEGEVYEVASMTELGIHRLEAWNPGRHLAVVSTTEPSSRVFRFLDTSTGELGDIFSPCPPGYNTLMWNVAPIGELWHASPFCHDRDTGDSYEQSGLYGDDGYLHTVLPPNSFSMALPLGDRLLVSSYAIEEDEDGEIVSSTLDYFLYDSTGASQLLAIPEEIGSCGSFTPWGPDRLAAACYHSEAPVPVLWSLPLDGSEPFMIAGEEALAFTALPAESTDPGATRLSLQTLCGSSAGLLASFQEAVFQDGYWTVWGAPSTVMLLENGEFVPVSIDQHPASSCHGSQESRAVLAGIDGLAVLDLATGASAVTLRVPEPDSIGLEPGQRVAGIVLSGRLAQEFGAAVVIVAP